ncbi:MAG: hypothetical protein NT012_02570 [Candidatus Nealsonbacteria bacterium]|nr:hypothetical protein [Candidatus Nealsonbacteria bacterium]
MKEKIEESINEKKKEKTYTADVVKAHIGMYSDMVHLTDNWHIIMSSDIMKRFEDTIKRVRKEFLDEFKDEGFYHYLNKMENTLKFSRR